MTPKIHPYLAGSEAAVLNAQAVARAGFQLRDQGFRPDVMIGNPGWGETLFLKDVWPDVPLISMSEFYYRGSGSDVGFDPEFDGGADAALRARTRAGMHLLAIDAADAAYAPTRWQRDQFPEVYRSKIRVIHDGIDWASYAEAESAVTVGLGSSSQSGSDAAGDVFSSIEGVRGSAFDDVLAGDAGNNFIEGGGGAGSFHGDLSGLQNARFVARVYGVDTNRLETFVREMAELGDHFRLPFRTYSAGMKARLAFAVSMGIDFDTYLIDEVTSVGDAAFRAKSEIVLADRIRDRAAIIVSHNLPLLARMCSAAVVLEQGRAVWFDDVDAAIATHQGALVPG